MIFFSLSEVYTSRLQRYRIIKLDLRQLQNYKKSAKHVLKTQCVNVYKKKAERGFKTQCVNVYKNVSIQCNLIQETIQV